MLKKKDNFWSLLRYSEYRPEDLCDRFILGRAENKIYLQPVYKKLKKLKSLDFLSVHNKLPDYIYKINLEGLIPKNRILSQSINLKPIHKPSSLYENKSSIKNWITLQAYLKLSTINYINYQNQEKKSQTSLLDLEYLKMLSNSLPYTLSFTQNLQFGNSSGNNLLT
ncbi:MAG: hypothetical protein HC932_01370 [Thermales bacterium]|nr:hypothetical protein [Thermales bacterium]